MKITDQDRWPEVLAWMLDSQQRLRSAVSAVGGVPTITTPTPTAPTDATEST